MDDFYDDNDPAYDYDAEGECPELPPVDGTYTPATYGWERVEKDSGYWVAITDGDYDETDADWGDFVGKWTDPKTAKVYIDRTFHVEDHDEAVAMGRKYDQLAIWDISASAEIRL